MRNSNSLRGDYQQLSPEQKELGREIVANGGRNVVTRSIDDVRVAGL
jgi:hypothetical protein